MDKNELPKKILWTNPGGQWECGQPKSKWIDGVEEDARKLGCRNSLVDAQIGGTGNICLGRPRPTQGCRADNDDDYPIRDTRQWTKSSNSVIWIDTAEF